MCRPTTWQSLLGVTSLSYPIDVNIIVYTYLFVVTFWLPIVPRIFRGVADNVLDHFVCN